ncbi:hypothetical protein LZY01_19730 [Levilactobacillus zymae]|uniref:Uncharacterized protein n=2 Tax=Levilactobacillus zymae TaxID=267363 RepID=A0ABQ0WY34_9LACO|nr:hypothetical protein [Levilactobacillus zymae]KRL16503.1 hypothetical protein FD38_GL001356 [Levilactobacillus zymae DSM 19395]GEO72805.1 hypothetical protein LZY01_19730 [Levilactobacillus zymae]
MDFVHRYMRIYVAWSKHHVEFLSWDKAPYNSTMELTSPFSTGINPDMNQLIMYNLTPSQFGIFLEGRTISATAGFYNADATAKNGGLITKGTIKSSTPMAQDGMDRTVQVNFNHFPDISGDVLKVRKVTKVRVKQTKNTRKKASGKSATDRIKQYNQKKTKELNTWLRNNPNAKSHDRALKRGEIARQRKSYAARTRKKYTQTTKQAKTKAKYAKQVKYANLSFKKGTTVLTAIRSIAGKANIPLGAVKLTYNHKFANDYTVNSKPLSAIKKLADIASTTCYIMNGKLYIREITTGQKAKLHLTPETGLLTHPTPSDDGSYDGQKYEAQSLMRQEIYVGALVYVDDDIKNLGKCVVLGGQREYTPSSSTVTFQFVPLAAYKKSNAGRLSKAKAAANKERLKAKLKEKNERAKDAKNRKSEKSKRASRHAKNKKK